MAIFYISSTFQDLKDYRREVSKVLRRRGHTVISMEDYGPSGRPPLEQCLEDVAKCDIYVGIVARRYGFIPPDNNPDKKSITECEYRHAKQTEKDCWIFLLEEEASWALNFVDTDEQGERVKSFCDELRTKNMVRFFKDRKGLRRGVKKALKDRFGRLHLLRAWLTKLFPPRSWYVTIPLALIAALLATTLVLVVYYWSLSPKARADFLIKYKIWPARFTDSMEDSFGLSPSDDPDKMPCVQPNTNLWSYSNNQWCLTREEALSVRGADWGMRKLPQGTAIYDFEMKFVVIFKKGNEATWVVRAQEGKRSGYVFKLQRVRGEGSLYRLFLHGWAYTPDGKQVPLGNTPNNPLRIGDIYEKDYFDITVTARENVFSHVLMIQNADAEGADRAHFAQDYKAPDFTDWKNYFPYGSVGFLAPEVGGEILFDDFQLYQPAPPPT